ncbi:MAG TPA: tetratricopeptide repeat protein [Gemmatimonadales bacterium]|nr:tetratricopeptide repeat protein [Gemmatimonadales bacterium]
MDFMQTWFGWSRQSLAALVLISAVAGCSPARRQTGSPQGDGKVPITTASNEARQDYLKGRDFGENLRAYDSQQLLKSAVGKDSTFALAYYNLALSAPTAKDFFDNLNKAVALADKVSEGERLMILGLQAGANADPAKQREYYEQLIAKYPQDERAHFLLGNAYFGQQDYAKTVEQYQKAIAIAPTYAPVYNLLGYAHRTLGNYTEAEQAFKKYIELIPGDPNPYDSYAELLMKTGRFGESIQMYRKALSVDPHFVFSHVGIANDFVYLGKHDSARAETQKLLKAARTDGDRRVAMFTNTLIYAAQGKLDLALQELEKQYALGERINDAAAMAGDAVSMGDVLLEAGRPDAALRRYEQAVKLLETSSLSQEVKDDAKLVHHFNVGRVALLRNDLSTAKAEARAFMQGATAKRNDAEVRQAHQLAGMIALQERDFETALGELAQANQQDAYNLYRMGLAYQGKGDKAKQQEMFDKAANLNTLLTLNSSFVRAKAGAMPISASASASRRR